MGWERAHEVAAECGGEAGQGVDAVPGAASFLEAGDDRLGGAHPLGQLPLAETGLGEQVVDELTESAVLFDACCPSARSGQRFGYGRPEWGWNGVVAGSCRTVRRGER